MKDLWRENLRQLFLDFIDLGEDEEAWKINLRIYDDLLAEVNNPLTCNRPILACDKTVAEVKRLSEAVTQYSEKDAWYVAEVKRLRSVIKDFESFLYFEGFNPKEVYDEGGEE